jgi:hypothetical protein
LMNPEYTESELLDGELKTVWMTYKYESKKIKE